MEAKVQKKLLKAIADNPVDSPEFKAARDMYLDLLKQDTAEKDQADKVVQKEKELILREQELNNIAAKDVASVKLEYAKLEQAKQENQLNREETRKARRWGIIGNVFGTIGSAATALLVCSANNHAQEKRANADRQFYADQINNVLEYEQTGVIHSTGAKTVVKDGLKGPKL